MTKKQVEKLLKMTIYFAEKVLFDPITVDNTCDQRHFKKVRRMYLRNLILSKVRRSK